jgi:hypothetical protein
MAGFHQDTPERVAMVQGLLLADAGIGVRLRDVGCVPKHIRFQCICTGFAMCMYQCGAAKIIEKIEIEKLREVIWYCHEGINTID